MLLSLASLTLILSYAGGDEKSCLPYSRNDIITSLLIVCGAILIKFKTEFDLNYLRKSNSLGVLGQTWNFL